MDLSSSSSVSTFPRGALASARATLGWDSTDFILLYPCGQLPIGGNTECRCYGSAAAIWRKPTYWSSPCSRRRGSG